MKLPEVLKHGILTGDWELICKVYTGITGEPISPPKPKEPDWKNFELDIDSEAEQVRADLECVIQHDTVPPDIHAEDPIPEAVADTLVEEEWVKTDPTPTTGEKPARREQMKITGDRPNNFQDNKKAFANQRVDVDPRFGAPISDRSDKKREDTSTIDVSCYVCKKNHKVSALLAHGYNPDPDLNTYRCNSCCSSRGK